MIDIRCHVLDGTKCGPESFAESLEICRLAVADGVHTIVATPRWDMGSSDPPLPLADCRQKLERLREEMRGALSLELGFVMPFSPALPKLVEQHGVTLALGGGRHVLISLPPFDLPAEVETVWGELARCGLSVIVTRPECNPNLRQQSCRLDDWVAGGAMVQIDSASVIGLHGRTVQRFAMRCVEQYESSVVLGSNARSADDSRHSLSRAREALGKKVGARRARKVVCEWPAEILKNAEGNEGVRKRSSPSCLSSISRVFLSAKTLWEEF